MTWKKLSTTVKYQNRFMTVTEDELVTDHNDHLTFGIVRKNPAVWIIASQGDKIILVRQYRYPVDFDSWELPAGHLEHKDVEEAARVELAEETGYQAGKVVEIGTFFPAPGHLDQKGHVFLATDLAEGKQNLEPAERGMQSKWFTLREVDQMIGDGTIQDGPSITAFKLFELHMQSK